MKYIVLMIEIILIVYIIVKYYIKDKIIDCHYATCVNKFHPNKINVHIIAHTHNDVGWIKTVEQYYYGLENDLHHASVKDIIDTVVISLNKSASRKFTYVEMAFFTKWWSNQNEKIKKLVKKLVKTGQLEFSNGGWVMNDEATTYYSSIIDQMSLGLDFINQTFGRCASPTVGWQIDTFGHSYEQANLFYEFGFDGWFFSRLDYRDHRDRKNEAQLEFLQAINSFQRNPNKLFTSILFNSYVIRESLCVDITCNINYMSNYKISPKMTISKYRQFQEQVIKINQAVKTNHIMFVVGGDFHFMEAENNFEFIDNLINYTAPSLSKHKPSLNVFYSTPSCYLYAINQESPILTVNNKDFFPYLTNHKRSWVGFYTSKPNLKYFIRYSENIYRMCKQLYTLSRYEHKTLTQYVQEMSNQIGIVQHHDAITGTQQAHVTKDYSKQLTRALHGCEEVISISINKIFQLNIPLKICHLINISLCEFTQMFNTNQIISIIVYNSLAFTVNKWIKVPVSFSPNDGDFLYVYNAHNQLIPSQIIQVPQITRQIPERHDSIFPNYDLYFYVELMPLSASTFELRKYPIESSGYAKEIKFRYVSVNLHIDNLKLNLVKLFYNYKNYETSISHLIENDYYILYYVGGLLACIYNKIEKKALLVTQNIKYYNNLAFREDNFNNGAYIFNPMSDKPLQIPEKVNTEVFEGIYIKEIRQKFSKWATLITRLYLNWDLIEIEWTIGSLWNDDGGIDVISFFSFDQFNFNGKFYVDSNGRQLVLRKYVNDSLRENYYPMVSSAIIANTESDQAFMIHTDRAQGCACTTETSFEVMLHRTSLNDDGLGVKEQLFDLGDNNDGIVARGRHWIFVGRPEVAFARRRYDALLLFHEPVILFNQNITGLSNKSINIPLDEYSSFLKFLPSGIHILSFENHFNLDNKIDYIILRLENLEKYSLTLDIKKIFKNLDIYKFEELNLSANKLAKDINRLHWYDSLYSIFQEHKSSVIEISPESIKTYRIYIM